MTDKHYYIEEDGIVFESFEQEPEEICEESYFLCSKLMLHDEPPMPAGTGIEESFETRCKLVTVDIDKLREAGVPEYVINMILENDEELSTIRITRDSRIILPEYKLEIKMPPLDKALYFLYLRHPEGIRFKNLCDHKDELSDIYSSITGRSELNQIRMSIESLINPLDNSVNEKCSRIKRAFTKAFSPELAKHYYIDGKSGEPKSIALDREFVKWETIRV